MMGDVIAWEGGLDGPLQCLPQNRMAPAKPALEARIVYARW
jgi:hypothetical protein